MGDCAQLGLGVYVRKAIYCILHYKRYGTAEHVEELGRLEPFCLETR